MTTNKDDFIKKLGEAMNLVILSVLLLGTSCVQSGDLSRVEKVSQEFIAALIDGRSETISRLLVEPSPTLESGSLPMFQNYRMIQIEKTTESEAVVSYRLIDDNGVQDALDFTLLMQLTSEGWKVSPNIRVSQSIELP